MLTVLIDIDNRIKELQTMLLNGNYKSSQYSPMTITDKSSGKKREIMRPKFYPDQCVQWAIMQVISPILSKGAYYHSYGSIPSKGPLKARRVLSRWIERDPRNTKYALQLDIKQYYPSVDLEILRLKLRRKIKCHETLELLDEILLSAEEGLPIGNYTSQWFANFNLNDLDHLIKQEMRVKYYIRYMDDLVLLGGNKRELHRVRKKIDEELRKLGLSMKGNWQVYRVNKRPIDFLGYRFYRDKTTLRERNFLRIKRRAKKISKKHSLSFKDSSAMMSYMGWVKSSDSHYFYHKYIRPYINIREAKEIIRNESREQYTTRTSQSR